MNKDTNLAPKLKIHFMGIGGSGMSAVSMIAKSQGYEVSGCDLQEFTPYLEKLKKANVPIFVGHAKDHIKNADILAVTPATFYQNKDHRELIAGKKKKLMQWQEFMGKYLQKNKRVICVTGTHGKSTTTTMIGLLYEAAGLDPTVEIGATVREWGANFRIGKGNDFINEADEFYGNFLNYFPDTAIINNIEFDHPDYFKSDEHVIETFEKFIGNLVGSKTLIVNQDSLGVKKLIDKLGKNTEKLSLVGYSLGEPLFGVEDSFAGTVIAKEEKGSRIKVVNKLRKLSDEFYIGLLGEHNVANSLGVIALSVLDKVETNIVKKVLKNFSGIGRRMELIGEKSEVKVYDDYAHHPTEIRATLSGLRQMYPKRKIICVVEPHMFSRTKILLHDYKAAFRQADTVFIAPIFKSRDTKTFGMSGQSIVDVADHKDISAFQKSDEAIDAAIMKAKGNDIIVVMGAGKSYQLAKDILHKLKG